MKYEDIKDFYQRCEEHPDHQSGMISNSMIQQRLHEEIDELREYIEKRTWVGLPTIVILDVYAEILKEWRGGHQVNGQIAFAKAIEQALKERNT
jgi:hypothetical protein